MRFGSQLLDRFPAFLLERCQYARNHNIYRFKLKHVNGATFYISIKPDLTAIQVVRFDPKLPGLKGKGRVRLATSEAGLNKAIREGITSYNALEWRG